MLLSQSGSFVVVGLNHQPTRSYYWRGVKLTEVVGIMANVDEDGQAHVRVRVQNTAAFDNVYAEMAAEGIAVKKVMGG